MSSRRGGSGPGRSPGRVGEVEEVCRELAAGTLARWEELVGDLSVFRQAEGVMAGDMRRGDATHAVRSLRGLSVGVGDLRRLASILQEDALLSAECYAYVAEETGQTKRPPRAEVERQAEEARRRREREFPRPPVDVPEGGLTGACAGEGVAALRSLKTLDTVVGAVLDRDASVGAALGGDHSGPVLRSNASVLAGRLAAALVDAAGTSGELPRELLDFARCIEAESGGGRPADL